VIHPTRRTNMDITKARKQTTNASTVKYLDFPVEFNPIAPKNKPVRATGAAATTRGPHHINPQDIANIMLMLKIPSAKEMAPFLKPTIPFGLPSLSGIFYSQQYAVIHTRKPTT
jgi:hypothetical protein